MGLSTVFGCIGVLIHKIRRTESVRGTGLVQGRWHQFNAKFFCI